MSRRLRWSFECLREEVGNTKKREDALDVSVSRKQSFSAAQGKFSVSIHLSAALISLKCLPSFPQCLILHPMIHDHTVIII